MKNLKLLRRLQASDMVTLILKSSPGERIDYFIIAKSINYNMILSGTCDGNIKGGYRSFNILLSGLLPMVEKGHTFRIKYENDTLQFISLDERLVLTPLCVEYHDVDAERILEKFQRFINMSQADDGLKAAIAKTEGEIADLQRQYNGVSLMHLSGEMQSSNPFGEDTGTQKIDDKYAPLIAEKKAKLSELVKRDRAVKAIDLMPFRSLAMAASRSHEMINFCETFAVMALKGSYILQKSECPVMAVQGSLLYQLLSYNEGKGFYWFENGLVFHVGGAEGQTAVFLEKYLPNSAIDSSIVTRGVVREKYVLSMKGILSITQLMKSKFPSMTFDMGAPKIILENNKGEVLETSFELDEPADTVELRRAMRGERVDDIHMSKIQIPSEVQSLLGMFRDKMTVYVKERKVVFQADSLYLVFGR